MLGLMLAGTEFALRGIDADGTAAAQTAGCRPQQPRRQWARWHTDGRCSSSAIVLITMSSQVKLPSLLALGFVAMALACRWGGHVQGVPDRQRVAEPRCRWR